jgi:pimeloyl-ACP methyl ester carboxylesterase
VKDVLAAVAFVTGRQDETSGNVILIGEGSGGLLALYAAALSDRVSAVAAIRTIDRYDSAADSPTGSPEDETVFSNLVPGVLAQYDLPDVVAAIAPRPVFLVNTIRGRRHLIEPSEMEKTYEGPQRMTEHLGAFFHHELAPNAKIPKLVSDWVEVSFVVAP